MPDLLPGVQGGKSAFTFPQMDRATLPLALFGLVAVSACRAALNYPSPLGPRHAGGAAAAERAAATGTADGVRLVTFNVQFGQHLDRAIQLLQSAEPVKGADVVALQEVDGTGAERIAWALGMSYVYYPAAVHPKTGRDFGNAVLSRWPIMDDRKVVLPHLGRFRRTQRAATAATILVGEDTLRVYSVHLSTQMEVSPASRRDQARAVLADAATFRRVIVAGDMNSHGIGEEFRVCGFLWPTKNNPHTHLVFNWDHIFLKGMVLKDSASAGVADDDVGASDHRAVWAVSSLGLPPEAGGC